MPDKPSLWTLLSYGDLGYGDELLRGLLLTLEISVCAYAVGIAFGFLGVGLKLHRFAGLRFVGDIYTTIIRALPELLLILLLYYTGTSTAKSVLMSVGLVGNDFEIPPFLAAVLALGFIQGAYQTEVFRGAIQSIMKGQIEAARAFGMTPVQRFLRIILPQMIRFATPGMGNQWLNVTKDSAIISVLGSLSELLATGLRAGESVRNKLFFVGITGLAFLILSITSMMIMARLEKHAARGFSRSR